jgi:acid stress chaperone HdeB
MAELLDDIEESLMKHICIVAGALAFWGSPAFAADQTLPLASMTCRQFVDLPQDTMGTILNWMLGYTQDSDAPAEINFGKRADLAKKLATYCAENPTHGIMNALDNISDADDDSDPLKSVVGTWTFENKQVWVVVRPDGSAMQCRIGPDGAVYFARGTFRAPDTLAWEKIWGDDKVVRDKDAISLTGKFGTFKYKADPGSGPSNKCQAS